MKVRSRNNSKNKRLYRVVIFSLFFIGVGFLVPKAISSIAAFVMYPVHATNVWLDESSSLVPTFMRDRESFKNEIEQLKTDLIISEHTDLSRKRLVEENNQLRQLLGINEGGRTAAAVNC